MLVTPDTNPEATPGSTHQQSKLSELIPAFRLKLEKAKENVENLSLPWYAYDILANIELMDQLLQQARLQLPDLIAGKPALDIGCADGQLSFFVESLGHGITAVDYPSTNANGMLAVKALKQALNSSVEILEADIDQGFTPPEGKAYSLVFLLGILYHLKNPFLILETLAKHAEYCFLSTRVARFAADGTSAIHDLPVAYLLDPAETNNDITNYWIFSQAGLKRLIKRTGWDICAYLDLGETIKSDPVTAEGDERVFCLLRRADCFTNGHLLEGWTEPVGPRDGWRWALGSFSIAFDVPAPDPTVLDQTVLDQTSPRHGSAVELELFLTADQLQVEGRVTITVIAGETEVATQIFETPGAHVMRFPLPPSEVTSQTLEFRVTPLYPLTNGDPRPLGLLVRGIKRVID
jgi:tRNA (mo5U34)-methyltransferase